MNTNRNWFPMTLLCFVFLTLSAGTVHAQTAIIGDWQNQDKGGIIRIYEENGLYYGRLIGSSDDDEDQRIKNQPHKIILFKDFEQKSDTKWCCGTIVQPKEKKELSGTLTLENETTLKVTGKKGLFSGSTIWKKV